MPIRRTACLILALLLAPLAARAGFDLDALAERARRLAAMPYEAPPASRQPRLASLSYDDYRDIRFRPEASAWRTDALPFELQFFHAGRGFMRPVRLYEVVDGVERPLAVPPEAFDYGRAAPAVTGAEAAEVVGFRAHAALNTVAYKDELIAFLGASYFRAVGAGQQYGLSARGLAVDTTGGRGEEFPAFEAFWFERPAPDATALTVHALLNGPSVAGAYRFIVRPGVQTEVEVAARVYLRRPVATLGLAPLTSMYLGGENDPAALRALGDFRPEVHDSDGLQVESADGEWLWRPLLNPARPFATSLVLRGVRGFGLLQRDRGFASYEDPEARYERRPGVWITPQGDWGAGRVELLQFHTPDETNDNVVAYWVPERLPAPGEPLAFGYTMRWQGDAWERPPGGWVRQSRLGRSHADPLPGELQFTLDFAGAALEALSDEAAPRGDVEAGDNARVLLTNVQRLPQDRGWRLTLKIQRLDPSRPVELRAYLRRGNEVLTETWTYALPPS